MRRSKKYIHIGKRICALAKNQRELAKVLGLTQQSVSGKMTGKIAVTLKDLDKLSNKYSVHPIYFFLPESVDVRQANLLISLVESERTEAIVANLIRLPEMDQVVVNGLINVLHAYHKPQQERTKMQMWLLRPKPDDPPPPAHLAHMAGFVWERDIPIFTVVAAENEEDARKAAKEDTGSDVWLKEHMCECKPFELQEGDAGKVLLRGPKCT